MMNWDEYLYGFAEHAAKKSKDSTKVGAALIGPKRQVLLTGYNGPPIGVIDSPDKFQRPGKYLYASHAEMNLIAFAAREGIATAGCLVYVTHFPCSTCARLLIQAGIVEVVVGPNQLSGKWDAEGEAARLMFTEAGVAFRAVGGFVMLGDNLKEVLADLHKAHEATADSALHFP